ncbi:MAG: DNA translocase FtsK 4TM domain-containing protein, partial [Clostridiales bacterium]|nr:DNA translocase FtsK 4TM domain-containing protein [Clostridiales bacterium]
MAAGTTQKKKARKPAKPGARAATASAVRGRAADAATTRGQTASASATRDQAQPQRRARQAPQAKPPRLADRSARAGGGGQRQSQGGAGKGAQAQNTPGARIEIKGILLTATGLLLMIAFFRDGSIGAVGAWIKSFVFGLFGWPAYFVPSAIIIAGVLTILSNRGGRIFGLTALYAFFIFVITAALIHTGYYQPSNYVNQNPFVLLPRFFFEAQRLDGTGGGGGFFGALLAMPFLTVFRVLGSQILLAALLLIDIILLTNLSVAAFLRGVGRTAGRGAQKLRERRESSLERKRGAARAALAIGAADAASGDGSASGESADAYETSDGDGGNSGGASARSNGGAD